MTWARTQCRRCGQRGRSSSRPKGTWPLRAESTHLISNGSRAFAVCLATEPDPHSVNSVHPQHSGAPFRQLHHYALLFHDEMPEALARGIESRLVTGTIGGILSDLAGSLIEWPHHAER